MDIGAALKEKAGPLPTWGWMVLVSGLALVYYVIEKKKAGTGSASSTTAEQQLLAAEEASAANAAQATAVQTPNYNYGGGHKYSWSPAAATTAPAATTPATSAPATVAAAPATPAATAPAPVASAQIPIFNSTYKVKKGQTLDQVAAQFGISRVDLAHANGLGTGAGLRTGQTLKVPSPAPGGKPNKAQ